MPILREELTAFVRTWNAHRIRAQPNRSHHVSSVPDELYRTGQQEGFVPDRQVLLALKAQLPNYGNNIEAVKGLDLTNASQDSTIT